MFEESSLVNRSASKAKKKVDLDLSMTCKSTIKFQARRQAHKTLQTVNNSLLNASQESVQDFILKLFKEVAR